MKIYTKLTALFILATLISAGYPVNAEWELADSPSVPDIAAPSSNDEYTVNGSAENILGTTITTNETAVTPELIALARSLRHDPMGIYEYVKNHIDYIPTYGIHNGASGCYLAGRGNEWDMNALLIALLRESGYTCRFAYGGIYYYRSDRSFTARRS